MLFTRSVSGTRVVPRGQSKEVAGVEFSGYGSGSGGYPVSYLTAACAVGLDEAELGEFMVRLGKVLKRARKK
ncbi:unnamed protein product, partial [Discosporangium mesarthrocarpum]